MNRRTFVSMTIAGAATPLLRRAALAQSTAKARNVVLIHGLFADGSSWSEVIARLQRKGIQATAVQNPLTTLQAGVEATQDVLALQQGPTVLVAHSFGGMILSEAGVAPNVSAVVYIAARAPDAGEDYTALASRFPVRAKSITTDSAATNYTAACATCEAIETGMLHTPLASACSRSPGHTSIPPTRTGWCTDVM